MRFFSLVKVGCLALPLTLPAGCSSESLQVPDDCTAVIETSNDDQTRVQEALIDAAQGDVVCVAPGTYRFTDELSVSVSGVTLRGLGEAVFDFTDQVSGGSGLLVTGNDFTLEGMTFKNMAGDGLRMTHIENVVIRDIHIFWDQPSLDDHGDYGLYPVGVTNILIEDSILSGAADAAIYVGQTSGIVVRNNVVHDNVLGIQLENTDDGEVVGNHAYNNTGGILVGSLPNLPVKNGRRAKIHDNLVEDNNHENFGDSTAIVGLVPPGLGIMVMAGKEVEITNNVVTGNSSAGILVFSRANVPLSYEDDEYDPDSDTISIHGNEIADNGYQAQGILLGVAAQVNEGDERKLADIVWDGAVPEDWDEETPPICITDNGAATFLHLDLENEVENPSTDLSPYDCSFPPVEL